jgi:hypothetical protein
MGRGREESGQRKSPPKRAQRQAPRAPAAPAGKLPRRIQTRLALMRPHADALELALAETTEEECTHAARVGAPNLLNRHVAPIENGFINLSNFVADLNEAGLVAAGKQPVNRLRNLELMESLGVLNAARVDRWHKLFSLRNQLQHDYPDVVARFTYRAAKDLIADLPGYLKAYGAWMTRLGFDRS